ncbi:unnamed protein product [Acanthoscelides obtectus]|uniref:Uncharacterized protein n=1 Tax=Acanthoscelides obtectus TaxID=200917 RepID=A0A9P0QGS4_ACAOB|nr:unnamed protein product [Acanthoscelides obtectus]CAK1682408.1 hypothetical protein AOBTE_LOCUS33609 [Acanthoscelides obtectus]
MTPYGGSQSVKKSEIQDWLRAKNIPFDTFMLKLQLLDLVKQHRAKYDKYIVDEMAKAHNKMVLRLPPYHCELNHSKIKSWCPRIKSQAFSKCTVEVLPEYYCSIMIHQLFQIAPQKKIARR